MVNSPPIPSKLWNISGGMNALTDLELANLSARETSVKHTTKWITENENPKIKSITHIQNGSDLGFLNPLPTRSFSLLSCIINCGLGVLKFFWVDVNARRVDFDSREVFWGNVLIWCCVGQTMKLLGSKCGACISFNGFGCFGIIPWHDLKPRRFRELRGCHQGLVCSCCIGALRRPRPSLISLIKFQMVIKFHSQESLTLSIFRCYVFSLRKRGVDSSLIKNKIFFRHMAARNDLSKSSHHSGSWHSTSSTKGILICGIFY